MLVLDSACEKSDVYNYIPCQDKLILNSYRVKCASSKSNKPINTLQCYCNVTLMHQLLPDYARVGFNL